MSHDRLVNARVAMPFVVVWSLLGGGALPCPGPDRACARLHAVKNRLSVCRLLALALAAWMAMLPVFGALATTHGGLDAVRSLAVSDGAMASVCGDDARGQRHSVAHHHADAHAAMAGKAGHGDVWSSFAHDLAHAWECCAQPVATLPMVLHRLPSLRPEAPAVQLVMAVIIPRLETLFRPPIR